MGRLAKLTVLLGALLAFGGCAMESGTADDELGAAEEELLFTRVGFGDPPTRLTLFSEAGLWGTQLSVALTPNGTQETIRLITKTQVESAGLLGRVSSVRLTCGARDAHVVLFNAYNTSTTISEWSEFGTGRMIYCAAGQTVDVNLHTQASGFADRVASVYFVQHARDVGELGLSWLVTTAWNAGLDDLPSGATVDGDPRLRIRSERTFDLRQDFELDSFWCEARHGHFVLRARIDDSGVWTASFVSRYVDTGTGDRWGCRSEMESALQSGGVDAAGRLAAGLNEMMDFAGDHPRHYLIPLDSMREFLLMSGGDPVPPPVVYDPYRSARGI
ncbi:MAG: hypothetical protein M3Y87_14875 [Myxococcota bacterium]|nr:hypothetical protein [Myxococcota bacterium]